MSMLGITCGLIVLTIGSILRLCPSQKDVFVAHKKRTKRKRKEEKK